MIVSKDIYEYLTNFTDNKTVVNMLSVNKRFNSEEFYHRVLLRKYSLLLKYKQDKSYKLFFVEMGYYIDLFQKDGIPYFPTKEYNPKHLFRNYHTASKYDYISYYAALVGYTEEVLSYQDKCFEKFNNAMLGAARGGHLKLVQTLIDTGSTYFDRPLMEAATHGHLDIVKLLYGKATWAQKQAIILAFRESHIDIIKFFLDEDEHLEYYDIIMKLAIKHEKKDIIDLLKQYNKQYNLLKQ